MTKDVSILVEQEKSSIDSISAHSLIVNYYQFRPAYTNEFILSVSKKMQFSGSEVLLDLCCGRGELASEFAQFSKSVFAVDGSPEMLKNKIARDNINFIQCDLNQEELILPFRAHWALIGSGIHWLEQASIQNIVDQCLIGPRKFLVTHRFLNMQNEPFFSCLKKLNVKWGKIADFTQPDFFGVEKMKQCGYHMSDKIRLIYPVHFGMEYLFNYQLSLMYGRFYSNVSSNLVHYKSELTRTISPFLVNGKLQGNLMNLANIYEPD